MAAPFRAAIDGGSRGNPGPAAWGVAVLDESGECTEEHSGFIGRATNNVAEYQALIEALKLAQRSEAGTVEIQCDSELVVKQILGQYRVRHPDLKPFYLEAKKRIAGLPLFRIRHVRREQNKQADRLVNVALDEAETQSTASR